MERSVREKARFRLTGAGAVLRPSCLPVLFPFCINTPSRRPLQALPRTTERPARECGDEPRRISTPISTRIVRGDPVEYYRRSKYSNSSATLFHGVNVLDFPCEVAAYDSTGAAPACRGAGRPQSHGRKSAVRGKPLQTMIRLPL